MCRVDRQNSSSLQSPRSGTASTSEDDKPPRTWQLWTFGLLLLTDAVTVVLVLTPVLPGSRHWEGKTDHYTLHGSLLDLAILAALRLGAALLALLISYYRNEEPPQPHSLYHPNGDKKTREELDQEALEEAASTWMKRFVSRPSFSSEVFALITQILALLKCLSRMNVEIGTFADAQPLHPIFWVAIGVTSLCSVLESVWTDHMTADMRALGRYYCNRRRSRHRQGTDATTNSWVRRISSNLSVPLLAGDDTTANDEENVEEAGATESPVNPEDIRGVSDIHGDANYKASWTDLLSICKPDAHLILLAFLFLLMAALAQVYIPKFTGKILDALEKAFQDHKGKHDSMWEIPGFMSNVKKLVLASLLGGLFSGIRGSIFTVVGGRVNVRLRIRLMDSLLTQDIGFFDTTKTGDITSRLSSDTTLVGDQVTLNVNVFLRSLVQAIGVLIFMFLVSWQLSILAFISVPVITVLSKWYGNYIRDLTKLMQKKLADGNSVSESVIGSMATVRAFDAAEAELKEFESYMGKYMRLNRRAAVAYIGYSSCVTALPQLVTALVVFYGGLIVRNGDMTSGELVSFLLYLSSLSDAFANIGYIFSSLTQAVGAADKVFELMHRKPRIQTSSREPANVPVPRGLLGVVPKKTVTQRHAGIHPASCRSEITLENVDLYYPARPQRRILNGMSLKIPAGSVVALVGQSGGGKSSVMSLVQHLYEPSAGRVMIDDYEVHELSPLWLSRNVSVVSQEPTLFGRSIKRNIKFGLEGTEIEPTDDEVKEAARLANAASFIEEMPLGYDTDVGERGVQLSGGQKQRIAIARALVRKPRILLLDEATSALDSESEALVQEAIDDMIARGRGSGDGLPGMTVLIVAHRLSTIRNADLIFVVQDGRVVEQGSHNDLIEKSDGAYKSLISRQIAAQQKLETGKTIVSSMISTAMAWEPTPGFNLIDRGEVGSQVYYEVKMDGALNPCAKFAIWPWTVTVTALRKKLILMS